MLHLASFGVLEAAALLAIPGTLIASWIAVKKLGPEKDALYITSAQGAAVIMDNLVTTLRTEIDRCRAENAQLETENEQLKAENAGLKRRHDGRRDDREPG